MSLKEREEFWYVTIEMDWSSYVPFEKVVCKSNKEIWTLKIDSSGHLYNMLLFINGFFMAVYPS